MPFNGLATYDNFEGIGEDISDLVAFLAPFETPLLEVVGTSDQPATNVKHEWLEDSLNPTTDVVSTAVASATGAGVLTVAHPGYFRVGDLVQLDKEVLLVTGVSDTTTIGVTRGYGATAAEAHSAGAAMTIIGNAALEGEDTDEDRTTRQVRKANYCQIMKVGVKLSGTAQAVGWVTTGDKLADAKVMRLRELLRDLEKTILLGRTDVATIGSDSARRTMAGIVCSLSTNVMSAATLTESALGNLLQSCYSRGSRDVDLIVAGGVDELPVSAAAEGATGAERPADGAACVVLGTRATRRSNAGGSATAGRGVRLAGWGMAGPGRLDEAIDRALAMAGVERNAVGLRFGPGGIEPALVLGTAEACGGVVACIAGLLALREGRADVALVTSRASRSAECALVLAGGEVVGDA